MTNRIRLLAGAVTLAGAALLGAPSSANATMVRELIEDPFGRRFCCGIDTNGDGKADSYCCYNTGCSATASGCVRST
jgi:hypothetical protein